jgi:hypothetical protein
MSSEMSPLTMALAEVLAPLGEDEERRAVEAALAHLGLRRPTIYGVELRIDKNRRSLPRRRIGVLLAELDGYLPYEVVVSDVAAVVSATARPDLMPPFSDEEVAEAAVVARTEVSIDEEARRWGVRFGPFYPSRHRHDGSDDGDAVRRLVGLHYVDANSDANVVPLVSAVVDLTGRGIVSVEHY